MYITHIQTVLTIEKRERESVCVWHVGYIIVSLEITYPASIIHALASLQLPQHKANRVESVGAKMALLFFKNCL